MAHRAALAPAPPGARGLISAPRWPVDRRVPHRPPQFLRPLDPERHRRRGERPGQALPRPGPPGDPAPSVVEPLDHGVVGQVRGQPCGVLRRDDDGPVHGHASSRSEPLKRADTNAAGSPPGTGRGSKASRVRIRGAIRSTRWVRQSSCSGSHDSRYHRPFRATTACGSTRCWVSRSPYPKRRTSCRCTASLTATSTSGSTRGPPGAVTASTTSTRFRRRSGMTWRTVASARTEASAMSAPDAGATASARAIATACSSSNSRGGRSDPAARR